MKATLDSIVPAGALAKTLWDLQTRVPEEILIYCQLKIGNTGQWNL